jgi:hypothetical protein
MQKLLLIVAAFSAPAPVLAQAAQPSDTQTQAQAAPADAPQTVKKTVCRDVDDERAIGSRLHSTTKICRVVEVPVKPNSKSSVPENQAGSR